MVEMVNSGNFHTFYDLSYGGAVIDKNNLMNKIFLPTYVS